MRKNQKYTKEEMYMGIELWKESGISQKNYCKQNSLSFNTFKYWLNKYAHENPAAKPAVTNRFLPVQVTTIKEGNHISHTPKEISIYYPGGIEVRCPSDIGVLQLKTLLSI
jgi:transposase-like protein